VRTDLLPVTSRCQWVTRRRAPCLDLRASRVSDGTGSSPRGAHLARRGGRRRDHSHAVDPAGALALVADDGEGAHGRRRDDARGPSRSSRTRDRQFVAVSVLVSVRPGDVACVGSRANGPWWEGGGLRGTNIIPAVVTDEAEPIGGHDGMVAVIDARLFEVRDVDLGG
jgi:hypothetical protein